MLEDTTTTIQTRRQTNCAAAQRARRTEPTVSARIRGGGIPTPAGGPRRAARGRTAATQQHTVYLSFEHPYRRPFVCADADPCADRRPPLAELLFGGAGYAFFVPAIMIRL